MGKVGTVVKVDCTILIFEVIILDFEIGFHFSDMYFVQLFLRHLKKTSVNLERKSENLILEQEKKMG